MTAEEFAAIYSELDMTLKQLSYSLGVTVPMIRYYITGHNSVPDDIAYEMREMLKEIKG